MNKIDIFGSKDLALLNKCMAQAGASQPVAYVCDPDATFLCATTGSDTKYTICGVPPSCLCISNATNNQFVRMFRTSSIADLIKFLFRTTGWLNFAAGASAIIAVLPVLIGAIGKVAGNDNLANACGTTGIIFEVCCGLVTTWTLAGLAYGIAQIGRLLGLNVWQNALNLENSTGYKGWDIPNTCPYSCHEATSSIQHEWIEFADNTSIAAELAFFAAGVSVVALICTCVGFCIQRKTRRMNGYNQQRTVNTNTTVTITQPLNPATQMNTTAAVPMACQAAPYPSPYPPTPVTMAVPTATAVPHAVYKSM